MELRIVKSNGGENTYCHQCGEPKFCGMLKLKGWKYEAKICSDCVEELRQSINSKVAAIKAEELKD